MFYKKTRGGVNVGKFYFHEGWSGAEGLLCDPGPYKAGVTTTIESFVPSWDGKYVVMALYGDRRCFVVGGQPKWVV